MRRIAAIACLALLVAGIGMSPSGLAAPAKETAGPLLEVGTNASCAYHSIGDAIAAASPGATIKVENTIFTETLVVTKNLTLKGGYNSAQLPACLTLTGLNHTTVHRTGASPERILLVDSAVVSVTWFIFEGNSNGGGVAVEWDGTLKMEEVIIQDNTANDGGGLNVLYSTAALTNCDINNNTATSWGGGMEVYRSTASLTDCDIDDNTAGSGAGGLDVWGAGPSSSVSLTRVAFRRNSAGSFGGAMSIESGGQVTTHDWVAIGIDGTTINRAGLDGGGVRIQGSGSRLTINASSALSYLSSNWADRDGGGIYVNGGEVVLNGFIDPPWGERLMLSSNVADADSNGTGVGGGICAVNGATVQADETYVYWNSARNGGGLYLDSSTVTGDDVRIQYNSVDEDGGGVWAGSGSTVSLNNDSEVGGWGGIRPNEAGDNGGGIYAEGGADVSLDASVVRGNSSYARGGGIYLTGASAFTATNGTLIERNETPFPGVEGGGIYAAGPGTQVMIDSSTVATNTTATRGGGLYVGDGARATIRSDSIVHSNWTTDPVDGGGGACASGADSALNVSDSWFYGNTSATDGGGILNISGTVSLDGAAIWLNTADRNGGGILNRGGTTIIDGGAVVLNTADQNGGGVYNSLGTVAVNDNWVWLNRALNGAGGGLYSDGAGQNVDITGCSFLWNSAPAGDGGAISAHRTDLSVDRSYFTENSSDGEGSAIHITGAGSPSEPTSEVVNCFILDNETTLVKPLAPTGPAPSGSSLYVAGTSAKVTHNTIARSVQASYGVYAGAGSTVTLTNNIISNFATGIGRAPGGAAAASYTLYDSNALNHEGGVVSTDVVLGVPHFVGGGNYHLTGASDAINAGVDAGVTVDVDGDPRPMVGGYDVGADEYGWPMFLPLGARDS